MDRATRITNTHLDLKLLRTQTARKYHNASEQTQQRVKAYLRFLKNTEDVTRIDELVDRIQETLHLDKNPLDFAWTRTFKDFFGYQYCLKGAWEFLLKMV